MALTQTTTLRVTTALRDEISRLAARRGCTMQEIVADAVQRLSQDEWWASVRSALDDLSTEETASYQADSGRLVAAAADGLDER